MSYKSSIHLTADISLILERNSILRKIPTIGLSFRSILRQLHFFNFVGRNSQAEGHNRVRMDAVCCLVTLSSPARYPLPPPIHPRAFATPPTFIISHSQTNFPRQLLNSATLHGRLTSSMHCHRQMES
ncbi:hypothetical protein J6590_021734 [Homalodisca vitripennis]|nr:hypothetical protein J6590_021734 [Homalodisca vitripennis]